MPVLGFLAPDPAERFLSEEELRTSALAQSVSAALFPAIGQVIDLSADATESYPRVDTALGITGDTDFVASASDRLLLNVNGIVTPTGAFVPLEAVWPPRFQAGVASNDTEPWPQWLPLKRLPAPLTAQYATTVALGTQTHYVTQTAAAANASAGFRGVPRLPVLTIVPRTQLVVAPDSSASTATPFALPVRPAARPVVLVRPPSDVPFAAAVDTEGPRSGWLTQAVLRVVAPVVRVRPTDASDLTVTAAPDTSGPDMGWMDRTAPRHVRASIVPRIAAETPDLFTLDTSGYRMDWVQGPKWPRLALRRALRDAVNDDYTTRDTSGYRMDWQQEPRLVRLVRRRLLRNGIDDVCVTTAGTDATGVVWQPLRVPTRAAIARPWLRGSTDDLLVVAAATGRYNYLLLLGVR